MASAIGWLPAPGAPSSRHGVSRAVTACRPEAGGDGPPVKVWRVRDRATMLALRRSRQRVRSGPLTVTFVPGDPGTPPQVAYAIGRKAGGAVVRNRLRRRLRAIVAELAPALRPGAYLLGATAEATRLSFEELRAVVVDAVQAIPNGHRR